MKKKTDKMSIRDNILQKLSGLALIGLGGLVSHIANDGGGLVFGLLFGVPLLVSSKQWIYW